MYCHECDKHYDSDFVEHECEVEETNIDDEREEWANKEYEERIDNQADL
jgi:hypothetical protein